MPMAWAASGTAKGSDEAMPDDATFEMPWLQQLALDSDYPLTEADKRVVEIAHTALLRADAVELHLGGKAGRLGECLVETAFLEGMLSLLDADGQSRNARSPCSWMEKPCRSSTTQPMPTTSGPASTSSQCQITPQAVIMRMEVNQPGMERSTSAGARLPRRARRRTLCPTLRNGHVERNDARKPTSCRRAQLRASWPAQTLRRLSRRPLWACPKAR